MSAVQVGAVAMLVGSAGLLGGFDQPKDAKDKPAAAEPETKSDSKATAKHEFKIDEGIYAETCTCRPPCPCELTGAEMSCQGVTAEQVTKGTYDGKDISGTRYAAALDLSNKFVRIYVDQKDPKKHDAAVAFAKAALAGFGTPDMVKDADIDLKERENSFTVTVDGGKTMSFKTKPMLGGDGKTPVTHTNTMDPVNKVMMQGQCVECTYKDGDKSITVKEGRNAYFNTHVQCSGSV
jgi:hypothetical protein